MDRYILSLSIIFCIIFISACYTPDYKPEDTIIPSLDEPISDSICDEIINISDSGSGSNSGGPYTIGDIIPWEHQLKQFSYCYPSCPANPDNCDDLTTTTFSLSHHPGKVFMIEMSAGW